MTTADSITQLQQQTLLLTQSLSAMAQGKWCGEGSADMFVSALDPNMEVACRTPLLVGDPAPAPPFSWDPNCPQPRQMESWTCSVCATDWVCRATGHAFNEDSIQASRDECQAAIGYPRNVNPTYGLMDASGAQLMRVILQQCDLYTRHDWLTFDAAYAHYSISFGCMSGAAWYHWVGVRGVDEQGNLWIANSAPGYDGVWDTLSRADFQRLGPFSCIWVVPS